MHTTRLFVVIEQTKKKKNYRFYTSLEVNEIKAENKTKKKKKVQNEK